MSEKFNYFLAKVTIFGLKWNDNKGFSLNSMFNTETHLNHSSL